MNNDINYVVHVSRLSNDANFLDKQLRERSKGWRLKFTDVGERKGRYFVQLDLCWEEEEDEPEPQVSSTMLLNYNSFRFGWEDQLGVNWGFIDKRVMRAIIHRMLGEVEDLNDLTLIA